MKIIKSIEHLSLQCCNNKKLEKLDAVAEAYHIYLQEVSNYYIENNLIPSKYVIPLSISTPLSARYRQTCGSQAIGVVKSYWSKICEEVRFLIKREIKEGRIIEEDRKQYYFANKYKLWFENEDKTIELTREKISFTIPVKIFTHLKELVFEAKEKINKPEIKNLTLNLDCKVAGLEKGKNFFDYFIKLSTLEKGKPVFLPIKIHKKAEELLNEGELKKIVRLKKRNNRWFTSFVIEKNPKKNEENSSEVGIDVGIKSLLVDSGGNYYGREHYENLLKDIKKMTDYTRRRQKEESCISKKLSLEDFKLSDKRYLKKQSALRSRRKNEIGRAINECVHNNYDRTFVLEDLSLNEKTKSRPLNRILNRSLLGYLKDKLRFRLMDKGMDFNLVQPAYSSQQCYRCGWVSRNNRKSQEHFICEICGYTNNADLNASLNISRRSRDLEINSIREHRKVKELLKRRFYDAHSVSSWLDLDSFLKMSGEEFREALKRQSATLKLENA